MKQVKDYKFLDIIQKEITSIQTNGMILNDISFNYWSNNISGFDQLGHKQVIDKKAFLKSYVCKIKNDGKKLILTNTDKSKDISLSNYVMCPMTDHRKFKANSHQFMAFNDIMEYKYLFYANFVKETFTREKVNDDIIFDRSDFLYNNFDINSPKSIKRFYLDKNNRNKILISLNKIYIPNVKIIKEYFTYDRYLQLLISSDKDEAISNLFYLNLMEAYISKHPIKIYSVENNRIIEDTYD